MVKLTKKERPARLADFLLTEGEKKFGKGSVSLHGLSEIKDWIDTRCFALNTAIGRPGIPTGRLTVIQGKESSGKTTLVLQILAECQKRGGITIYLECESAFEKDRAAALGLYNQEYVEKLGLDVEPLIILKPAHIHEAFSMIEYYTKQVRDADPDILMCIAWDSVAATPTAAEASDDNQDYGNIRPGDAARQVSAGLRRLTHIINEYNVALIATNFLKEKINAGGFGGWGDNTATIAQKPLGQHASVRIELVRIGDVGGKGAASSGLRALAKLTKNKIAPPKREAEFDLYYLTGTDNEGSMLDMAKARGIVKQAGAWMKYGDESFQRKGWETFEKHDEIVAELKRRVELEQKSAIGDWKPEEESEEDDPDEQED